MEVMPNPFLSFHLCYEIESSDEEKWDAYFKNEV